ncbi:hypothetical protein J6590_042858 [Homalodisca vitripennis]|nr:hypothetical protein J6590_042858 [Homalodisca vitripennis]
MINVSLLQEVRAGPIERQQQEMKPHVLIEWQIVVAVESLALFVTSPPQKPTDRGSSILSTPLLLKLREYVGDHLGKISISGGGVRRNLKKLRPETKKPKKRSCTITRCVISIDIVMVLYDSNVQTTEVHHMSSRMDDGVSGDRQTDRQTNGTLVLRAN